MAREQSLAKSIKEKIIKALTESHYPMYHDVSIFQSKTVYIIKKWFLQLGHLDNLSKSGRPRKISIRQNSKIRRLSYFMAENCSRYSNIPLDKIN